MSHLLLLQTFSEVCDRISAVQWGLLDCSECPSQLELDLYPFDLGLLASSAALEFSSALGAGTTKI